MSDSTAVDTVELRVAASQMDTLFDNTAPQLSSLDRAITDSSGAWVDASRDAFGQFATYLDGRRDMLLRNIVEISDGLVKSADNYDTQDQATAAALLSAGDTAGLAP